MEQNSPSAFSQRLAIGLSIALHLLLLLAGYYTTISRPVNISTGYSITLTSVTKQQTTPSEVIKKVAKPKQPIRKKSPQSKPKPSSTSTPQKLSPEKKPDPATVPTENTAPSVQSTSTVDERGLYQAQPGKQAGVKLDLAGWMWDTAPKPQDDTEESGKIVFEIKIDELGEVIAVKILEKTISPLVEKIYKDALTKLTFSRTSDNIAYAPAYTGKVTFILRTK